MQKFDDNMLTQLVAQIDNLEIKIAFQEHTIDELNEVVATQQNDIAKINQQLNFLLNKIRAIEPTNIAKPHEETPPPHY